MYSILRPDPDTAAADAHDRLVRIDEELRPRQAALKAVRAILESVRRTDRLNAEILFGMYYCLAGDPRASRRHHLTAISIAPRHPLALANYAHSLQRLGYYDEARQYALLTMEVVGQDPTMLSLMISNALKSLKFRETKSWILKWKQSTRNSSHPADRIISEATRIVKERKIEDIDAYEYSKLIIDVLHANGIYRIVPNLALLSDEDSEWFVHSVPVFKGIESVTAMNFDLAKEIARAHISATLTDTIVLDISSATVKMHGNISQ